MSIRKAASYLKPVLAQALDVILPPHSLMTGEPVHGSEGGEGWQRLTFLDDPCCAACGYPFEFDQGSGALCGRCHVRLPRYDRGRSAIIYDEHSRKLVLDFKHGGRTDGLHFFAKQMQRSGADLLMSADLIVPVPLHNARLRKRKFNQSALLARRLSQISGVPYETEVLQRVKNTPSQGGQSFVGRRKNMGGAFGVLPKAKPQILGVNFLIIDDVLTSGATLEACASTLKRAGAGQVDILTLMRVVRPVSVAT